MYFLKEVNEFFGDLYAMVNVNNYIISDKYNPGRVTDIKAAINDMKENRYTTRLKLCSSKEIVRLYQKRYKKKCLNLIVPFLEKIVQNYNNYEWTLESIEEYRKTERKSIAENKKEIEQAIGLSFELVFGRNRL